MRESWQQPEYVTVTAVTTLKRCNIASGAPDCIAAWHLLSKKRSLGYNAWFWAACHIAT